MDTTDLSQPARKIRWAWCIALWAALTLLLAASAGVVIAVLWQLGPFSRGQLVRLDPKLPFRISLGRGSGMYGLEPVSVRSDGSVTVHRLQREFDGQVRREFYEKTALRLPPEAVAKVLEAVEQNHLLGLQRAYHEPGVDDGSQWVLWIDQGGDEKAVYFNNRFPEEIDRFAAALDKILEENGLGRATWHRVADADARGVDRALWDSIKR